MKVLYFLNCIGCFVSAMLWLGRSVGVLEDVSQETVYAGISCALIAGSIAWGHLARSST